MNVPASTPALVVQMAEDLGSPSEDVRYQAIRAAQGDPTVPIGLYLRALGDHSPRVRREAQHALTTSPATSAVLAALGDTLSIAGTERLRAATAESLFVYGETARATLELVMTHGTVEGRRRAAALLGDLGGEQSISTLTAALRDTHAQVRLAAIEALERVGVPEAVEVLVAAVHTATDLPTRLACLDGLVSLRQAPPLPLLFDALKAPATRRSALHLLAIAADPSAAKPCIDALADRSAATRAAALIALDAIRAQGLSGADFERAHEALSQGDFRLLREALDSKSGEAEVAAMTLAGWLGAAELAAPIAQRVLQAATRRAALVALGAMGEAGVDALLRTASDASPAQQAAALEALGGLGAAAALPFARALIGDPDAVVANAAARAVASLGDPSDAILLLRHLEKRGEAGHVAREGLLAMGSTAREAVRAALQERAPDADGGDEIIAALIEVATPWASGDEALKIARDAFARGGPTTRIAAANLAAKAGLEGLAPALLSLFQETPTSRSQVLAAIEALARVSPGARGSLATAIRSAIDDASANVRVAAARAAVLLDPEEALAALSALAQADVAAVSVAALRAVVAQEGLSVADRLAVLERACEHEHPEVVRVAARALGAIDDAAAARALTALLGHARFEVRMAATLALSKHTEAAGAALSAQLAVEADPLVRDAIRTVLARPTSKRSAS